MSARNAPRSGVTPCAPPAPTTPGRWHKLFVVPKTGEHSAYALAPSVTWLWRHYVRARGRFELCLEPSGQSCLLCQAHMGRDQSGYLPVLMGTAQVTMAITSGAWLSSRSLREMDGRLRGYLLRSMRLHPRVNGPLRVWLPGDVKDARALPAGWDVLSELDVRYGLAERGHPAPQTTGERGVI
jgi:hypothetical protein